MTWDELVDEITTRHPGVRPAKMFGMPCLKRENGKVFAGHWKDGGMNVKLTDVALPGAELFDPGMGRVMKEWVLVPETQNDHWLELVEQAI